MLGGVQAELARLLHDLLEVKLGHVVGDNERQLVFDVSLGIDDVDLLHLATSGFNVEEVTEDQTDEVEQGEEEVNTPGTLGSKQRGEHDHGKVANPVGAGRGGRTGGTGTEGVDLGRVDPGKRQEGKCEEGNEEEDTNSSTLGVLLALVDQASHRDDKTKALACEANQVQLATANLLNHKERRDGCKGVDSSEDTTHDQGQLVLHLQVLLEQESGVVDGGVTTGELLEELARATNETTLEFLGLATSEDGLPVGLVVLVGFHIGLQEVEFVKDGVGVGRGTLELSKNLASLLVVSLLHKPGRGIREEHGAADHNKSEEDLEGNGESPLDSAVGVPDTEDDPVSDKGATSDHSSFETDEESTVVGAGAFRLPDRNSSSVHSVSDTRDNTTNHELADFPVSSVADGGDQGTDNQGAGTHADHASPTKALTEEHGEQRAEEATDLITGSDTTANNVDVVLLSASRVGGHLENGEGTGELLAVEDTGHHALVVTEERETHDRGEGDAHPERFTTQAAGGRPHFDGANAVRAVRLWGVGERKESWGKNTQERAHGAGDSRVL